MSAVSAVIILPLSRRNLVRTPLIIAAVSCLAASAGTLALTTSIPIAWFVVITLVFGITTNHGLHVIGLIMVAASALGLVIVLADRSLMAQPRAARHVGEPAGQGRPADSSANMPAEPAPGR